MKEISKEIFVVDYDPNWALLFEEEAVPVAAALGVDKAAVEHIGSTAVPGLAAKPIVDIAIGVRELALDDEQLEAMQKLGYEYRAEAGVPGRLHFQKFGEHAFNVHVMLHRGQLWQNNILFRDYLRSHPETTERYAELKRHLAAAHPHSLVEYSDGKKQFIEDVLRRARRGQSQPPSRQ